MFHAYSKLYLDDAQENLARMLEYAVYDLDYTPKDFIDLFLRSGIAERFGMGDFRLLGGMSGVELAWRVLWEMGDREEHKEPTWYISARSREYWAGWALAYYQWETSLTFKEIFEVISIDNIIAMYSPYHEMDIRHFVDKLNRQYRLAHKKTRLQELRERHDFSQSTLADFSEVPQHTIQKYESWQDDINQAPAELVWKLAKALFCKVEDILERVPPKDQLDA